ncbi:MAG TPA: DAK2 domain-containing protein [Clostridia bacterium]
MSKNINGATLRKLILSSAKLLDQNKSYVDSLNVFPVPDGDTGTNMSLTMLSASKEIENCPNNNIIDLSNALSKGALRGARGNSGVILSQIFKGMTSIFVQENEDITPKIFARALKEGSDVAYKAVTKPKEGTILTVIRGIADHALSITKKSITMEDFLKSIIDFGEQVLLQTPEMLPVLKKAGVVDAGGRGLLIILTGFYNVITNIESTEVLEFNDKISDKPINNYMQFHADLENLEDIEFAYCTEFFIINIYKKTTEADIDRFREKLMTIGDCVLVIGDLSLVKVHVHTNNPGTALQSALELGELDKIKIENMLEQNRAIKHAKEELKPMGMVSVCAGEGLTNIFKDLMVDYIIEGGQTMNPSADDIAKAADNVMAENVFIFPNNKNIILAAEQAKEISKRNLIVIPTVNIPQGIACALSFDPEADLQKNTETMMESLQSVKAGQVTYAVRSTTLSDDMRLEQGDIIGIDSKDIVAKGQDVNTVTKELVDKMMDKDVSNITLYFGYDVSQEDAESVVEELSKKYPKCDVDCHFGGQPLYYYIIALE